MWWLVAVHCWTSNPSLCNDCWLFTVGRLYSSLCDDWWLFRGGGLYSSSLVSPVDLVKGIIVERGLTSLLSDFIKGSSSGQWKKWCWRGARHAANRRYVWHNSWCLMMLQSVYLLFYRTMAPHKSIHKSVPSSHLFRNLISDTSPKASISIVFFRETKQNQS